MTQWWRRFPYPSEPIRLVVTEGWWQLTVGKRVVATQPAAVLLSNQGKVVAEGDQAQCLKSVLTNHRYQPLWVGQSLVDPRLVEGWWSLVQRHLPSWSKLEVLFFPGLASSHQQLFVDSIQPTVTRRVTSSQWQLPANVGWLDASYGLVANRPFTFGWHELLYRFQTWLATTHKVELEVEQLLESGVTRSRDITLMGSWQGRAVQRQLTIDELGTQLEKIWQSVFNHPANQLDWLVSHPKLADWLSVVSSNSFGSVRSLWQIDLIET